MKVIAVPSPAIDHHGTGVGHGILGYVRHPIHDNQTRPGRAEYFHQDLRTIAIMRGIVHPKVNRPFACQSHIPHIHVKSVLVGAMGRKGTAAFPAEVENSNPWTPRSAAPQRARRNDLRKQPVITRPIVRIRRIGVPVMVIADARIRQVGVVGQPPIRRTSVVNAARRLCRHVSRIADRILGTPWSGGHDRWRGRRHQEQRRQRDRRSRNAAACVPGTSHAAMMTHEGERSNLDHKRSQADA